MLFGGGVCLGLVFLALQYLPRPADYLIDENRQLAEWRDRVAELKSHRNEWKNIAARTREDTGRKDIHDQAIRYLKEVDEALPPLEQLVSEIDPLKSPDEGQRKKSWKELRSWEVRVKDLLERRPPELLREEKDRLEAWRGRRDQLKKLLGQWTTFHAQCKKDGCDPALVTRADTLLKEGTKLAAQVEQLINNLKAALDAETLKISTRPERDKWWQELSGLELTLQELLTARSDEREINAEKDRLESWRGTLASLAQRRAQWSEFLAECKRTNVSSDLTRKTEKLIKDTDELRPKADRLIGILQPALAAEALNISTSTARLAAWKELDKLHQSVEQMLMK